MCVCVGGGGGLRASVWISKRLILVYTNVYSDCLFSFAGRDVRHDVQAEMYVTMCRQRCTSRCAGRDVRHDVQAEMYVTMCRQAEMYVTMCRQGFCVQAARKENLFALT